LPPIVFFGIPDSATASFTAADSFADRHPYGVFLE
jgi:hypothetical protein